MSGWRFAWTCAHSMHPREIAVASCGCERPALAPAAPQLQADRHLTVNAIAAMLSEMSLLMEGTAHPEFADALRIGAAEIERLHRIAHAYPPPFEYELHRLATRFLAWPLPDSVCSDLCVTDSKYHEKWQHKRSGTNLLTEDEAKQMLRHVLELKP